MGLAITALSCAGQAWAQYAPAGSNGVASGAGVAVEVDQSSSAFVSADSFLTSMCGAVQTSPRA